jgi:short-subunit dehydrogenase
LNVASTACYQPIPYMSVYAATQAFIQSFSLAIREELKSKRVYVSCLCPGPTATDFFDRAGLESLPVNSNEIKMSSEEVAEVAIEGLLDHVAEIIPGTSNTIGAYFSKLFPNKLVLKTVSGLFAPKS